MNAESDELEGYHVIDGRREDVGAVVHVWHDPQGRPEFLGVHVGILGRTHLIPLRQAEIDRDRRLVFVPYFNDTIRNTRHLVPGARLTVQDRWELYHDYNLQPPAPGAGSPYEADLRESGMTEGDDLDTPANPV